MNNLIVVLLLFISNILLCPAKLPTPYSRTSGHFFFLLSFLSSFLGFILHSTSLSLFIVFYIPTSSSPLSLFSSLQYLTNTFSLFYLFILLPFKKFFSFIFLRVFSYSLVLRPQDSRVLCIKLPPRFPGSLDQKPRHTIRLQKINSPMMSFLFFIVFYFYSSFFFFMSLNILNT